MTSIEKAFADNRIRIFFSIVIAFVLAAAVTIDQQSKNLIKLLVVAGIFATLFNWREIKRNSVEIDKIALFVLSLYFISILLSIASNPFNNNTLHDLQIMSIGFTSIFIWGLMISIRFRADYFWWGIILCALSTGIYALVQVGMHGMTYRAVGSSGKPIMFGDIAMISGILSIAATNHFKKHQLPIRFVPMIAFVMGVTASLLSGSRGSWLFLPVAFAIVPFSLYKKGKLTLSVKKVVLSLILISSALYLVFTYTNFTQRIEIAYSEIRGYITADTNDVGRTSLGQRFEMWKGAITAFKEAPFIGIGPGAFDNHLERLAIENQVNRQVAEAWKVDGKYHPHTHAHNEYLNTLATRGLLGITTVLILFGYFSGRFISLVKSDDPINSNLGLAGLLLVSGYAVFALSESVLYHAMTANFFFITLVSLLYLSRKQSDLAPTSA